MNEILKFELQQYRRRVLEGFAETTHNQAALLTQGSHLPDLTGSLGSVNTHLEDIGADLARLVATTDQLLPEVVELLADTTTTLTSIAELLVAPRKTQAAEWVRDGTEALARAPAAGSPAQVRKWYELAAGDFTKAIGKHGRHPATWYCLGIARERLGQHAAAADAFAQCAFFGISESLALGATAVLLAAALYRRAGKSDKSREVLKEYLPQLDRCAELHLALGLHHGARDHLRRAMAIWPFLAADARAAGSHQAEIIAAELCRQPDSPTRRVALLQIEIQRLAKAAQKLNLEPWSIMPQLITFSANRIDSLVLATTAWPGLQQIASEMVASAETALQRLAQSVEIALSDAATARREGEMRINRARYDGAEYIERAAQTSASRITWLRKVIAGQIESAKRDYDRRVEEVRRAGDNQERFMRRQQEAIFMGLQARYSKRIERAQQTLRRVPNTVADEITAAVQRVAELERGITAWDIRDWQLSAPAVSSMAGRDMQSPTVSKVELLKQINLCIEQIPPNRPWVAAAAHAECLRHDMERAELWAEFATQTPRGDDQLAEIRAFVGECCQRAADYEAEEVAATREQMRAYQESLLRTGAVALGVIQAEAKRALEDGRSAETQAVLLVMARAATNLETAIVRAAAERDAIVAKAEATLLTDLPQAQAKAAAANEAAQQHTQSLLQDAQAWARDNSAVPEAALERATERQQQAEAAFPKTIAAIRAIMASAPPPVARIIPFNLPGQRLALG